MKSAACSHLVLSLLALYGALSPVSACTLAQIYLAYRQGGFAAQPLRFFGPPRAAVDH